jgi:hypothetical protein
MVILDDLPAAPDVIIGFRRGLAIQRARPSRTTAPDMADVHIRSIMIV